MERKRVNYIIGIVVASAAIFLFFRNDGAENIVNYPPKGTDIIAFGDSLVAGTGASSGRDFVSLLSEMTGTKIINLGVPGNTTADGLLRISELDKYKPKVVLLLLGGNDHLKKIPIETTFINLGNIIADIQGRGAVVLLLGVKGNLFGDKFEPEFEKLRRRYGTAYVPDVLDGLFGSAEYMADAIHPNDAGNRIIAERIYPVLSGLLK